MVKRGNWTTAALLWISLIQAQHLQAGVTSFGAIQRWFGTGGNRAAIVIDWGEPERPALIWGYRWDGMATGEDMFLEVVAEEPDLYARVGEPGAFGLPIYGIGIDRDSDGFALSDGTSFVAGIAVTAPSDGATATDASDSYVEGWASAGFWAYYTASSSPYSDVGWEPAQVGAGDRVLSDGDWDGFRFAPGFSGEAPRMPRRRPWRSHLGVHGDHLAIQPVPEPSDSVSICLGLALACLFAYPRER